MKLKAIRVNHVDEVIHFGDYCVVSANESCTRKDIVWACPNCHQRNGHNYDNRGFNEQTLSMSGKYMNGESYKKILVCAKCNWHGEFENETFFSCYDES